MEMRTIAVNFIERVETTCGWRGVLATVIGTHQWVWDMTADLPRNFSSDRVTVEVRAE